MSFTTPLAPATEAGVLVTQPRLSDMAGGASTTSKRPRLDVQDMSFEEVRAAHLRWRYSHKQQPVAETLTSKLLRTLLDREEGLLHRVGVAEAEVLELRGELTRPR